MLRILVYAQDTSNHALRILVITRGLRGRLGLWLRCDQHYLVGGGGGGGGGGRLGWVSVGARGVIRLEGGARGWG